MVIVCSKKHGKHVCLHQSDKRVSRQNGNYVYHQKGKHVLNMFHQHGINMSPTETIDIFTAKDSESIEEQSEVDQL